MKNKSVYEYYVLKSPTGEFLDGIVGGKPECTKYPCDAYTFGKNKTKALHYLMEYEHILKRYKVVYVKEEITQSFKMKII